MMSYLNLYVIHGHNYSFKVKFEDCVIKDNIVAYDLLALNPMIFSPTCILYLTRLTICEKVGQTAL